MKTNDALRVIAMSCLVGLLLCSFAARADDEADKLKQLERAMTAPPDRKIVSKPRTRAIVFDAAPQDAASQVAAPQIVSPQVAAPQVAAPQVAPPQPAASQATAPQAAAGQAQAAKDCSKPAADAKITAVDFAIQFKVGSAELTESSEKTLLQIAKIIALSNNCVLVEGHTDSAGNVDRNLELSRQRADSVVKFISGKEGINQSRLVPVGKGSSEPVKNLDARNPMNRRVVFKVVG